MSSASAARFDHLTRMTDARGVFEHADGTVPRAEHGYCTDDNARLLVVSLREPGDGIARRLGDIALEFVLQAQDADGRFRNRMDRDGVWTDLGTTDDCWGRALWSLGATAAAHQDPAIRARALAAFDRSAGCRSPWTRSMAFAALGAAAVMADDDRNDLARSLLADTLAVIPAPAEGSWLWPEPRLRYANAVLAEAVIAAGAAFGRRSDVDRGLTMLAWLLDLESPHGHLSVTGAAGRGPDDAAPQFDQQAIEVAAMADACWRAWEVTGDHTWSRGISVASGWFVGDNDRGFVMFDKVTGGGYDGMHDDRVNLNQGAESTLAFVSTMQRARSMVPTP